MSRLNAVADRASGAAFGLTNYNNLEADVNYLVVAGNTLASASTINITSEYHVISGTTTIQTINDASTASNGQQVRLMFQSALTLANGTGNIATLTGNDRYVSPGEIVLFVRDAANAVWREAAASNMLMRITTAKTVNNTTTDTDLLSGSLILPGGLLGTQRGVRITAWGDWLQNGATVVPTFKVKMAGTTVLNTGASPTGGGTSRAGWRAVIEIINRGATNSQWVSINLSLAAGVSGAANTNAFSTGEGTYWTDGEGVCLAMGGGSAAIDTTVNTAIVFSVVNGAASASYETKLIAAIAEVI